LIPFIYNIGSPMGKKKICAYKAYYS